jgi:hypothetical protein
LNDAITIRHSTEADRASIQRLAELDGRRAPQGEALLAFASGELIAALPLGDGARALADPFRPTADVVQLLELRAAQGSDDGGLVRRLLGRPASSILPRRAPEATA